MTNESSLLLAEALKRVTVTGNFCPAKIGARIGLGRPQSETAARVLSNAGVLVLGFDFTAEFSPDYRNAHAAAGRKAVRKK